MTDRQTRPNAFPGRIYEW